MKHIFIILSAVFLFSCTNGNDKTGKNNTQTITKDSASNITLTNQIAGQNLAEIYDSLLKDFKYNKKILLSNSKAHCFSDNIQKDTFKLIVTGDSINHAVAIFSINSFKGKRIYADTFASFQLFENTKDINDTTPPTSSELEKGINKGVHNYFDNKNFIRPTMDANDQSDNIADTADWEDIKTEKNAIGFECVEGSIFRIAWSDKQHRVLIYWMLQNAD